MNGGPDSRKISREVIIDEIVKVVTPVKTGVQGTYVWWKELDSGFRRNDGKPPLWTFYEIIILFNR